MVLVMAIGRNTTSSNIAASAARRITSPGSFTTLLRLRHSPATLVALFVATLFRARAATKANPIVAFRCD
jgi:hypothetical protein